MKPCAHLPSAAFNSAIPMPLVNRSSVCWPTSCLGRNLPAKCTIMQSDSIRVTLLVTNTLEKMGIPYAVGGSLASSVHGVMRSTLDVDILAAVGTEHIQPLVAALSKEFYADDE